MPVFGGHPHSCGAPPFSGGAVQVQSMSWLCDLEFPPCTSSVPGSVPTE